LPTAATPTPGIVRHGVAESVDALRDAAASAEAIRTYFVALERHDQKTMDSVSSSWLREQPWAGSMSREYYISNVVVFGTTAWTPSDFRGRPGRFKQYYAVRQGSVSYVQLRDGPVEDAGPSGLVVTVVKETASSPWRVDEMGTG
jgi:ABC-type amino acid transport substrate-binding protein